MKVNIKLRAISYEDGRAFIQMDSKIFLLRHPYDQLIEASEKDVEKAICFYAYEPKDVSFQEKQEVIDFLRREYVEYKKKQGAEPPSVEELAELLNYASDDILREFLTMAKDELIPDKKLEAAKAIASQLMKLERVRNDLEMIKMASNIMEEIHKEPISYGQIYKAARELAAGLMSVRYSRYSKPVMDQISSGINLLKFLMKGYELKAEHNVSFDMIPHWSAFQDATSKMTEEEQQALKGVIEGAREQQIIEKLQGVVNSPQEYARRGDIIRECEDLALRLLNLGRVVEEDAIAN
jgi:hypothetical protein